ncbi:baseplate J/gp47 family protein [Oxalobacter paraformigenes]|uniref:Baseplate protein J-like domain-containing protein n=1 Tax=Oxalobacter paraformigenes TaxID=556268 RepID=C3X190_9BURK|nr:baseplate J/gp47 family protein [Oxalobacter paraformigenes]EEO26976.1 hypothetical protein OFAG_00129 [Oxalobacter paraformigenes]
MAFDIPTKQTLINRIVNDVISRRGVDAVLRRSDDAVYSRVNAGAFNSLYGLAQNISKEINVATAVYTLDDKAGFWLPADPRREATAATGPISVTGRIGDKLGAGTEFIGVTSSHVYAVVADVVFDKTDMTVTVEAIEAGAGGNLAAGEMLMIGTPVGTVGTTAVSGGILGGADRETDEHLRERILERMRNPPKGGDDNDYKRWAKEVPGVTRVWVYPNEMGPGAVTIRFMRDGDVDPVPGETEIEKVYDHLYAVCPVTVRENLYVVAPLRDNVELNIVLYPDTDAVRSAIVASVTDFFACESEPGGTLYWSRLDEAISSAKGEYTHKLLSPDDDITAAKGHISMLGDITWS